MLQPAQDDLMRDTFLRPWITVVLLIGERPVSCFHVQGVKDVNQCQCLLFWRQ